MSDIAAMTSAPGVSAPILDRATAGRLGPDIAARQGRFDELSATVLDKSGARLRVSGLAKAVEPEQNLSCEFRRKPARAIDERCNVLGNRRRGDEEQCDGEPHGLPYRGANFCTRQFLISAT